MSKIKILNLVNYTVSGYDTMLFIDSLKKNNAFFIKLCKKGIIIAYYIMQ